MANVSNPYEINTENNLVVTSWVDEAEGKYIEVLLENETTPGGVICDNTAIYVNESATSLYGSGASGQLISHPSNFNLIVFGVSNQDSGGDQILFLWLDEVSYEYVKSKNFKVALVDSSYGENPIRGYNLKLEYLDQLSEGHPNWLYKNLTFPQISTFYNYNNFVNSYLNKTTRFDIIEYNNINEDLIMSEEYNGHSINIPINSPSLQTNGFFVDDHELTFIPYKTISNFYKDGLKIRFAANSTYNKIRIDTSAFGGPPSEDSLSQLKNVFSLDNITCKDASGQIMSKNTVVDVYLNDDVTYVIVEFDNPFTNYLDFSEAEGLPIILLNAIFDFE